VSPGAPAARPSLSSFLVAAAAKASSREEQRFPGRAVGVVAARASEGAVRLGRIGDLSIAKTPSRSLDDHLRGSGGCSRPVGTSKEEEEGGIGGAPGSRIAASLAVPTDGRPPAPVTIAAKKHAIAQQPS
jgi:hypothetical protein